MRALAMAMLAGTWMIGCGDDGLETDITRPPPATATGTGASTGTGATATGNPTPPVTDCAWVGTWIVDQAVCEDDIFPDWFEYYDETKMVNTHGETRGCDAVVTLTKAGACVETETWFMDPEPGDDQVEIRSEGITGCDPADCKFAGPDVPCEIGARANTNVVLVDQRLGNDRLVFTHLLAVAAPSCTSDFHLRFVKQPE